MLMVIQFVSKEINCFLLLLKSCKNGVIDFLRQGDKKNCMKLYQNQAINEASDC